MSENIKDKIVVLIPMYNEEKVIRPIIESLKEYFDNIVVVDDGSSDGSIKKLSGININIISHCINLGQGAAISSGFEYVKRGFGKEINGVVTCDADGQHSIEDVVKFARELLICPEDIIFGSRFLGFEKNIPFLKRLLLRTAKKITNKFLRVNLTDTHNGLKAFKLSAIKKLDLKTDGYAFETELVYQIAKNDLQYKELPTNIIYTEYSKSKGQPIRNSLIILEDIIKLWSKR